RRAGKPQKCGGRRAGRALLHGRDHAVVLLRNGGHLYMTMNEDVRKHVNISSQRPLIFDTRMLAIFGGGEEKFWKVPLKNGIKFAINLTTHPNPTKGRESLITL
ncbi:MAG: hypothetical protein Q4C43_07045, partial [Prevotella sp.]|nr:hypothetical protein [Prevotella sp.]